MNNNFVVIMAGGIGSRFFPFSRKNFPKQFHDVLGTGRTLLQQTADRFQSICPAENIYIVTHENYKNLVKEQLPFLSEEQILCEPEQRNTAPCIAYAAYKIGFKNPNALITVAPADHIILDTSTFVQKLTTALSFARKEDVLLTLGITPTRPDTGYGYIQFIENQEEIKKVKTFREKPQLEVAQQFISNGDYVWNAGIFVWNVSSIQKAFERYLPKIHELFFEGKKYYFSEEEKIYINRVYPECQNVSIDVGIMEQAENVRVILGSFGWSDLGTWKSLYEILEKDSNKNVCEGNLMLYNTTDCIIKTPDSKLVILEGLSGYIVAEFDNVLMVCRKEKEQMVKKFVEDATEIGQNYT